MRVCVCSVKTNTEGKEDTFLTNDDRENCNATEVHYIHLHLPIYSAMTYTIQLLTYVRTPLFVLYYIHTPQHNIIRVDTTVVFGPILISRS